MELSKVSDGFVDADTLIIKAQVQVIRYFTILRESSYFRRKLRYCYLKILYS